MRMRASNLQALRGSALASHTRGYGVMSDLSKKTQEALDK